MRNIRILFEMKRVIVLWRAYVYLCVRLSSLLHQCVEFAIFWGSVGGW